MWLSFGDRLVGLAVNAIWHVEWADPVASLCLVPFIVREGWEAFAR
jgi:Co/Zn/Cd efflux system component